MTRQQKMSFGLSLTLHLVLLLLLWIPEKSNQENTLQEPIELVMLEPKKTTSSSKKPQGSKTRKSYKKPKSRKILSGSRRQKILNQFKPKLYNDEYVNGGPSKGKGGSGDDWSDKPVLATLNGLGLSEYSSNYHFFEVLSQKINQGIHYPEDYAFNKLTGKFWIKILIDRKGRLLQVIDSSKKSPILCSYVLVNLYQILKSPLPKRFWYDEDKTLAFLLNFDFSVSSVDSVPALHHVRYHKNKIDFQRRAKIPNLLEEVTRDYARYFPPIAPTPVGPVINFVQVYRMIRAWQELDPIQRKRQKLELTKDRMEKLLKIEQEKHHE